MCSKSVEEEGSRKRGKDVSEKEGKRRERDFRDSQGERLNEGFFLSVAFEIWEMRYNLHLLPLLRSFQQKLTLLIRALGVGFVFFSSRDNM